MRFTSSVLLKNNRTASVRSKIRGKPLGLPVSSEETLLKKIERLLVLVELNGIEPMTSCLQSRRSPN